MYTYIIEQFPPDLRLIHIRPEVRVIRVIHGLVVHADPRDGAQRPTGARAQRARDGRYGTCLDARLHGGVCGHGRGGCGGQVGHAAEPGKP